MGCFAGRMVGHAADPQDTEEELSLGASVVPFVTRQRDALCNFVQMPIVQIFEILR